MGGLADPSTAASRWGESREQFLLLHGRPERAKEVPTSNNSRTVSWTGTRGPISRNRAASKPRRRSSECISSRARVETSGRDHAEQVQRVKKHLATRKPKTVNNVLTVLNTLLKKAVEWGVIDRMPCTIRLLRVAKPSARFHDFADYERLVTASRDLGELSEVIVLLGGEAGLRCGEIAALE